MRKLLVLIAMVLVAITCQANSLTVFQDFVTLELAAGNAFLFIDKSKEATYGEFSIDAPIIGDLFVSYANEFGDFKLRNLAGIGFNINPKPFTWLKLVQYQRLDSRDWQTTAVWGIVEGNFVLDGIIDRVNQMSFHSTQLKYSLSRDMLIGVEYSNTNHKPTMGFLQYKF